MLADDRIVAVRVLQRCSQFIERAAGLSAVRDAVCADFVSKEVDDERRPRSRAGHLGHAACSPATRHLQHHQHETHDTGRTT